MRRVEDINGSRLYYIPNPGVYTGEYYRYCLSLLRKALCVIDEPINVWFCGDPVGHDNSNRTIRVDIQPEHTLVKLGGRSVDEVIWGDIDLMDDEGKYLVRIPNYEYYSGLDCTIEYSLPNIANIGSNPAFSGYLDRATYIAPIIYDGVDFESGCRTNTISMFSTNPSERRESFFQEARDAGTNILNVQGVFDKEHLKQVYKGTKIMVNVHQTDHHHTFEELRVLPALCNGTIIVSEDVPLKDKIPYADSIVWCPYGELAKKVREVQDNYDEYYRQIFTHDLAAKIMWLGEDNLTGITDKLR